MKITLCGSIAFHEKMLEVQQQLEKLGHEVRLPPSEITGPDGQPMAVKDYYELRKKSGDDATWVWDQKERSMRTHFEKVVWSDLILVTNYEKKVSKAISVLTRSWKWAWPAICKNRSVSCLRCPIWITKKKFWE